PADLRLRFRSTLRLCRPAVRCIAPRARGDRRRSSGIVLGGRPRGGGDGMSAPVTLEVEGLAKHFPVRRGLLQRRRGVVRAVDGVTFSIGRGETLGLVGESGCGKTTLSRMVLKLIEPTAGRIRLGGVDVTRLSPAAMWEHRRRVQIVFQDPYS